jgi:hypothetical protein
MGEKIILNVTPEFSGIRIDKYISDNTELTRSAVQGLIGENISVDGKSVNKNYKLKMYIFNNKNVIIINNIKFILDL